MPTYEIRITELAYDDLTSIVDYIASDNPSAALQMADKIEQCILSLKDFPDMGVRLKNRQLANRGYKMLIINDYLVFYVIAAEVIEIRRIISGRRHYTKLL
jgi:toxin ParE1/3/4